MEKPLNNKNTFLQSKEPNNEIIANWQETARRVVVSKLTGKEIRNYENADLKKLATRLQKLSIWLTNNSIEEEFALPKTMKTLSFSWPDFSLEEIEHAIDMALANKFDEKIELKANYLSPMYLFGCMRLYRAYRGKVMTEYWDAVQAYHDKNYVPDPSESKLGVAISVVTCYAKYLSNPIKEHHEYKSVIYSIIYSNLKGNGFFPLAKNQPLPKRQC